MGDWKESVNIFAQNHRAQQNAQNQHSRAETTTPESPTQYPTQDEEHTCRSSGNSGPNRASDAKLDLYRGRWGSMGFRRGGDGTSGNVRKAAPRATSSRRAKTPTQARNRERRLQH